MRCSFLVLLVLVSSVLYAQEKVDLPTYSPLNPKPFMDPAPLPHNGYGEIVAISHLWQHGDLKYTLYYNEKGVVDSLFDPQKGKFDISDYSFIKDKENRIVQEKWTVNLEDPKLHSYSYDDRGNLVKFITYRRKQFRKGVYKMVEDKVKEFTYDNNNRLISGNGYDYDYSIENNILTITYGSNGSQTVKKYDNYGRLIYYDHKSTAVPSNPTTYTYVKDHRNNIIAQLNNKGDYNAIKIFHYSDGSSSTISFDKVQKKWAAPSEKLVWNGYTAGDLVRSQGLYKKGKLQGIGWVQGYGKRVEGNFKNNMLHGPGYIRDFLTKDTYTIGNFKAGKLDGYGIKIVNGIAVEAGIYKNGNIQNSYDLNTVNGDTKLCSQDVCEDGFVQKKTTSYYTKSYGFYQNGKPIGPAVEFGRDKIAVAFFDSSGVNFFLGPNQNYYVIAHYKDSKLEGMGYIATSNQYQVGKYENNQLVQSYRE
ncbi:hypothetical protein BST91_01410 [Nonlabens tegetincola]|nr:hypothetical protein BST91_01410 [Nonlabens tegetincola]